MSTLRNIISCLVVLVLVGAPVTAARAEMQMPEAMAAEVTQYPGSTVVLSQELPGGNLAANLNCGKATQEEVANYYKAKLTEKGYTANVINNGTGIVAFQGERKVMVGFENENGDTVVTLVLYNGEEGAATSSGQMPSSPGMPAMPGAPGMPSMPGAPGMPSMPGTMPQMPTSAGPPTTPTMPTMPTAPMAPAMPGSTGIPGAGQAKYPAELTGIVAQYPGSQVLSSHVQPEEINVVQAIYGATVDKIADYYKTEVVKGGWQKTNDMNIQGNIGLEFEKDDLALVVMIQNPGGMFMVTVALDKH